MSPVVVQQKHNAEVKKNEKLQNSLRTASQGKTGQNLNFLSSTLIALWSSPPIINLS